MPAFKHVREDKHGGWFYEHQGAEHGPYETIVDAAKARRRDVDNVKQRARRAAERAALDSGGGGGGGGADDKENEPEATMQEEASRGVQPTLPPPSECVESECLLIDYTDTPGFAPWGFAPGDAV